MKGTNTARLMGTYAMCSSMAGHESHYQGGSLDSWNLSTREGTASGGRRNRQQTASFVVQRMGVTESRNGVTGSGRQLRSSKKKTHSAPSVVLGQGLDGPRHLLFMWIISIDICQIIN
jgi:hypothetical protein